MRLVLRGAATRLGDAGSLVVAASPDSLARQPWQWDVRVAREPVGQCLDYDGAGIGAHHVCVRTDPELVTAALRTARLQGSADGAVLLERPQAELWLAVVESGRLRHADLEARPGDVLIWEGDDPLRVDLEPLDVGVVLALVVLARTDGRDLRWAP